MNGDQWGAVGLVLCVVVAAAVVLVMTATFKTNDLRRDIADLQRDLQWEIGDLQRDLQWEIGALKREIEYRADRHDRDVERLTYEVRRSR